MKKRKIQLTNSWFATTRKRLGLTQEQLAGKLNVSRSTIVMVEHNRRTLPTGALIKLLELEKAATHASALVHVLTNQDIKLEKYDSSWCIDTQY